ncbi:protein STICHEL isoform X2 [Cornus florida]|uniref:protein STICHEL isoform X2 n=1 Tax=Cornus florida TaxID=4283 RepID=UPI002898362A|nr:protein STICHEL isoform X2 [Cornus florida]
MSEMRGGGGGGRGGFDPSNLHLRKELTQIRKAARVLRDPGTTSSWRSPLNSARSAAAVNVASSSTNHYLHQYKNGNNVPIGGDDGVENGNGNKVSDSHAQFPFRVESNGKEKKVFLYNWRSQRSSSEKSDQRVRRDSGGNQQQRGGDDDDDGDGSSSVPEESVEDSLSDARNGGDSRSDTCISDRYASLIFRCKDTNLTPSIRRTNFKKKSKKNTYSSSMSRQQLQQIVRGRNSKRALEGLPSIALGLGRDDSISLVDQSEDTEEYCNSDDFRRISAASPFLSRLKNKNWSNSSLKLLRNGRKEDSSYSYSTPALSTSSYNRYGNRNPSTIGSWDGTTVSFNDGDDEVDDQIDLPGRQGCGIPCYWSKRSTPKHRGVCGGCYSPSLSDTLRRKGSSILCGSQTMYHRRRGSSGSNKRRLASRAAQGLVPLLTNSGDGRQGSSVGTGHSDDELSTNFGELDLEGLSRLDGRRWSSSCRSQEGLELVALNGEGEEASTPDNIRSLSQKYRPMFFEELIGQNIVVQSLMNAISRGRIAPVYLFQGPRGTGKTSTARIFAAALNCLATQETRPCGVCRECTDFISGETRDLREVDGTNKKGIDQVRYLLKGLSMGPPSALSRYKVFAIDECHLLPSKTWLAFLKFLEKPLPHVVFIFITTDLDNVPRTILSRCQKYLFSKIKEGDIVTRLRKISADENLDVESDALDLIALNADGSLRDAETMLDQLSLLGKKITTSLVNELVGVVSDEKLLELLELAMSSDTAETVKRARELMDSGVEPMVLMSQMATLIMDIIAGTNHIGDTKYSSSSFGAQCLSEAELERLKHALKLLSEAEKQLRVSSERSTWFTATLLQLGSVPSSDPTHSGSSRRQSSKTNEEDPSSASREATTQRHDARYKPRKSTSPTSLLNVANLNSTSKDDSFLITDTISFNSKPTHSRFVNDDALAVTHDDLAAGSVISKCINSNRLDDIWIRCIERCHSKRLRELLHTHGKLASISEVEGVLVAHIAFGDRDIRTRAERFLSSITNSFEIVLQCNVEVRIVLLLDGQTSINSANKPVEATEMINRERKTTFTNAMNGYSDTDMHQEPLKISRGSFNDSEGKLAGTFDHTAGSPVPSVAENAKINSTKERKPGIPMQRIESIIREQRLETAWLQAVEKGTPGSLSRLKPEKNQVLPQEGMYHHNQTESGNSMDLSSQHWEDELNHEIKALNINDGKALQKEQNGKRIDHYPMSPSLLHNSSFAGNFNKESTGYESGSGAGGCSGLFCWNNAKPPRRGKVKQGTPVVSHRDARFSWFGECGKPKKTENRFRR